jgi:phosphate transport system substrate-binding protein
MEIKLALDGLTMVINKENTWATEMTKDEIVKMYLSGSYNAEDKVLWSDIRADWPAEEVKFYGPNENYVSNKDKITAVKVDFGNGPVEPTLETIGEDLPYAGFTRPVFTYLNLKYAMEKPQVLDYAKYVVAQGAAELAGETGFAPLPMDQYEAYLAELNKIG